MPEPVIEPLLPDASEEAWAAYEKELALQVTMETSVHLEDLARQMRGNAPRAMRALRLVGVVQKAASAVLGELGGGSGDYEEVGMLGDVGVPAAYDAGHRLRAGARRQAADQMDVAAAVRAQRLYAAAAALREARELGDERLQERCRVELDGALGHLHGAPAPLPPFEPLAGAPLPPGDAVPPPMEQQG